MTAFPTTIESLSELKISIKVLSKSIASLRSKVRVTAVNSEAARKIPEVKRLLIETRNGVIKAQINTLVIARDNLKYQLTNQVSKSMLEIVTQVSASYGTEQLADLSVTIPTNGWYETMARDVRVIDIAKAKAIQVKKAYIIENSSKSQG